MVGGDAR